MHEAKMEILGGWEGSTLRTTLGEGMDIFWNNTISKENTRKKMTVNSLLNL